MKAALIALGYLNYFKKYGISLLKRERLLSPVVLFVCIYVFESSRSAMSPSAIHGVSRYRRQMRFGSRFYLQEVTSILYIMLLSQQIIFLNVKRAIRGSSSSVHRPQQSRLKGLHALGQTFRDRSTVHHQGQVKKVICLAATSYSLVGSHGNNSVAFMSQEALVEASGLKSELSEESLSNALLPALPEEVESKFDEAAAAVAATTVSGLDSTIMDISTHSNSTSLSTFLEQDQDAVDGIESHRRMYSRASSIVSAKTIGTSNPDIPAAASGSENDDDDDHHDDDNDQVHESSSRILLGICAMDKKARSKPMAEILSRLDDNLFKVLFFGDEVILNQPIEDWPICDVIIAFFSKGYPLRKAMDYVELRKPLILNDLGMQELMQDRRRVYDLLEASGIDVPRHVYLTKDGYVSTGTGDGNGARDQEVQEFDDHIEVNGVVIHKPFVEKPVDAEGEDSSFLFFAATSFVHLHESRSNTDLCFVLSYYALPDHSLAVYFPTSAGGGCKKLFRKIGNRSSEFYPDINEVRRDGSYIYEEFVETQGTDVKMYTVGPGKLLQWMFSVNGKRHIDFAEEDSHTGLSMLEYGHAEARKSPTVDGKVERNPDGKEVRFPVILTYREKEIARRVVLNFKQFVCGFDILRVQEGHSVVSYVCDVNGWSFVKKSRYVCCMWCRPSFECHSWCSSCAD